MMSKVVQQYQCGLLQTKDTIANKEKDTFEDLNFQTIYTYSNNQIICLEINTWQSQLIREEYRIDLAHMRI